MKSFSFCYWDKKNWREIQKTIYMTVKMVLQVMDQLVDIVYYMYQEIHDNFGPSVLTKEGEEEYKRKTGKLGTSGLALHYANIINQIESVFLRSNSITGNIRDTLYQGLSPTMKASLRSRLQQSSKKDAVKLLFL
jgi:hypothetical protein